MKKIKLFFQKLIPFLKKRGIKGAVKKLLVKLHLVTEVSRVLEDYDFIVGETVVPLNQ